MKKTNINLKPDKNDEACALNETIISEDSDKKNDTLIIPEDASELSCAKTPEEKTLEVGGMVSVKPETKRFCDGRGIPDYARTAFIKRINDANKTIVVETKPNGKELGVLFIADVIAM